METTFLEAIRSQLEMVGSGALLIIPALWLVVTLVPRALYYDMNRVSKASDPGGCRLSRTKLKFLDPEGYSFSWKPIFWIGVITGLRGTRIFLTADHLFHGDSRAAIVVSVSPLIVAAYTDELDCVALLQFPDKVARFYHLQLDQRLLTVNRYTIGETLAPDLEYGPRSFDRYVNFSPLIADFLSDDIGHIQRRKRAIAETEWERAATFGYRRLTASGGQARSGDPFQC